MSILHTPPYSQLLSLAISLPKTILVNFKHLTFKDAIKLPLFVRYDTDVKIRGKVTFECPVKFATVHFGFHDIPTKPKTAGRLLVDGNLIIKGPQHIGMGSIIHVAKEGVLELGDNFAISGCSTINCYKHIVFGRDIQFAWDCLVMDSDTHTIYSEPGVKSNNDKEILFGDKIWIGCNSTILKGSSIPSNCVIGAGSLVSSGNFTENNIIAGNPAKSIKKIFGWKL